MAEEVQDLTRAIQDLTRQLNLGRSPGLPSPGDIGAGGGGPFGGIQETISKAGGAGGFGLGELALGALGGGAVARGGVTGLLRGLVGGTAAGIGGVVTAVTGGALLVGELNREIRNLGVSLQNTLDPLQRIRVDIPALTADISDMTDVTRLGSKYTEAYVLNLFEMAKLRTGEHEGVLRDVAKDVTLLQQTFDPAAPQLVTSAVLELGMTSRQAADMLWELKAIADQSNLPYEVYSRAVLNVVSNLKAWGLTIGDVRFGLADLLEEAERMGVPFDLVARDYGNLMRVFETAGPEDTVLTYIGMMLQRSEDLSSELSEGLNIAAETAYGLGRVGAPTFQGLQPYEFQYMYRELGTESRVRLLVEAERELRSQFKGMGEAVQTQILENFARELGFHQIEDFARMIQVAGAAIERGGPIGQERLNQLVEDLKKVQEEQAITQYDVWERLGDIDDHITTWYQRYVAEIIERPIILGEAAAEAAAIETRVLTGEERRGDLERWLRLQRMFAGDITEERWGGFEEGVRREYGAAMTQVERDQVLKSLGFAEHPEIRGKMAGLWHDYDVGVGGSLRGGLRGVPIFRRETWTGETVAPITPGTPEFKAALEALERMPRPFRPEDYITPEMKATVDLNITGTSEFLNVVVPAVADTVRRVMEEHLPDAIDKRLNVETKEVP